MIKVYTKADSHAPRYTPFWDLRAPLHLSTRPGYNSSTSWSAGNFSLGRRQDGGLDEILPPEMDDYCVWRCTIATCGCYLTSTFPARPKRWDLETSALQSFPASTSPIGRWNQSALTEYSSLNRRGSRPEARFDEEPRNAGRFTRAELDAYLPSRLEPDPSFTTYQSLVVCYFLTPCCTCPPTCPIFIDARHSRPTAYTWPRHQVNPEDKPPNLMSTVAAQMDFSGRGTIQFGTGGLHGCTVITLVSNRGVWMAHFWQGYACKSFLCEELGLHPGSTCP